MARYSTLYPVYLGLSLSKSEKTGPLLALSFIYVSIHSKEKVIGQQKMNIIGIFCV